MANVTKIDRAGIQRSIEIMVDSLDKLGFNTPGEDIRSNSSIAVAVKQLNTEFDLKVINMYLMTLLGELQVELNATRDQRAGKGIQIVRDTIEDIKGHLRG